MAMVRGTNANKTSTVPTGGAPSRGNSGKTKNVKGKGVANVMPSVRPASSDKRGGPAKAAPSRKGSVSSGGGSFGQQ